jgi:hypothetical protein
MLYSIATRNARTKGVALTLLATAMALLAACGGGDSTSPNPPGPPPPPPPPPPPADVWSSVVSRTWSMPSATESYECHEQLVSTDTYITGFRLVSPSAAQTELYLVMLPSVTQTGDYSCALSAIGGGEAIYLASTGTTQLEFAGGKGVHVPAGTHLLLAVHIYNKTASSVSGTTTVEGRVGTAAAVTTPMDMIMSGRLDISLPADSQPVIWNGGCEAQDDTHFVAAIPLMRSLGVHQTLYRTIVNTTSTLLDEDFDPQHILYTTLSSDVDMPADVRITSACTYVNNTGAVVSGGESAADEECFTGIYRYPPKPPTTHSPYDCALLFPI